MLCGEVQVRQKLRFYDLTVQNLKELGTGELEKFSQGGQREGVIAA
jgi:hypothetical protein